MVVCPGQLPGTGSFSAGGSAGWSNGGSQQAAAAASTNPADLDVTPSIALAAAAGAIPTPTSGRPLQPNMSLGRVCEDRVLSPEPTEDDQQEQQEPQEQTREQDQNPDKPAAASSVSTLTQLGSFTTTPGLRPSPSMILAAAAGAIAVPPGADYFPRPYSSASLDELPSPGLGPVQQQNLPLPAMARGGSNSTSALEPTPSMALAAAAGMIPYSLPGSASSSRHQSPTRLPASALSNSTPQLSPVPMSKLAAARPRPLVSAFVKAPVSVTSSLLASAAPAAGLPPAAEYSMGLTKASMAMPVFADVVCEGSGLHPVGEVLLVPDLSAAVDVSWLPETVMAPVDMMEKDLCQPWSCCPRSALKRALAQLESRHGLTLVAGFELEFVLLKPAPVELFKAFPEAASTTTVLCSGGQAWVPLDSTIYCQTAALDTVSTEVLVEVVAALQAAGIGVPQFHAEAAPGQFEVVLSPFPALQAADKLLLAREIVTGVVSRHGLAVTWLPKPMADQAGSGCHVHLSLWRGGNSVMADTSAAGTYEPAQLPPGCYPLSSTASSFLSGLLDNLPALLLFTAPSVNSYERLKPNCWSGAFGCWGYDNREAPLRACCPRGGQDCINAEFKAFDGSTNPYIGLAALVAAGMQGLEFGSSLPAPAQYDPGAAENAAAAARLQKLPNSLTGALQAWESNKKLQAAMGDVLGKELVTAFTAVRRCEAKANSSVATLLLRY